MADTELYLPPVRNHVLSGGAVRSRGHCLGVKSTAAAPPRWKAFGALCSAIVPNNPQLLYGFLCMRP